MSGHLLTIILVGLACGVANVAWQKLVQKRDKVRWF